MNVEQRVEYDFLCLINKAELEGKLLNINEIISSLKLKYNELAVRHSLPVMEHKNFILRFQVERPADWISYSGDNVMFEKYKLSSIGKIRHTELEDLLSKEQSETQLLKLTADVNLMQRRYIRYTFWLGLISAALVAATVFQQFKSGTDTELKSLRDTLNVRLQELKNNQK